MTDKETGVKCALVDAFTRTPFTGNTAAVCLLDNTSACHSDAWMQSVSKEFNVSITAFVSPHNPPATQELDASPCPPRFGLRWFTTVAEVDLCGHGTLAATHFLFEVGRVGGDVVEFVTRSGVLAAKKVGAGCGDDVPSIELEFPVVEVMECEDAELPSIPFTLGTASVVAVKKIASGDLLDLQTGRRIGVDHERGRDVYVLARDVVPSGLAVVCLFIQSGSCLWERTLCLGTLLERKAGEMRSGCLHGISEEWEVVPPPGGEDPPCAYSWRGCNCYGGYFTGLELNT